MSRAKATAEQRARTYHALMYALLEARRVLGENMSPAEFDLRSREIFDTCYGDVKPKAKAKVDE